MQTLVATLLAFTFAAEVPTTPAPPPVSPNTLTLEQALTNCDDHQPQLVQALANTQAAQARVNEARGAWLPQINGSAALVYTNYFGTPNGATTIVGAGGGSSGSGSSGSSGAGASGSSVGVQGGGGRTVLGLSAYQLLYDFNQTLDKIRAAGAAVSQYKFTQDETVVTTHQTVRSAYYNARGLKALQDVARDTLENEKKHLTLTEAQIRVGTQPEIALATERATYATDVYQAIQAVGNYNVGRSQLNQAMGVEGSIDYEVQAVDAPPVAGEDKTTDQLMDQALKARPAFLAIERQIEFQAFTVSAYRANLLPNIFLQGGVSAFATRPSNFAGDLYGELELTWPLFNFTNISDIKEQQADLVLVESQRDQLRQQIRVDLETARLNVVTYKESVQAAHDAVTNAHEQLRLAEGRYQVGVGNVIELGDAQVAYTTAEVQEVTAMYNLNNARATLLAKLGIP